jgi:hypothetical protein
MTVLGLGTASGLVFALPVKTGSVACPPAHEGRVNCLLQHVWAPAGVKFAAALLGVWLLSDLLTKRVPQMRLRWRDGERLARRATDRGREAVLGDSVLAAASWGIVPTPGKETAWRVVKPTPRAPARIVIPDPAPAPEPTPVAQAPEPAVAPGPAPVAGLRAITATERRTRSVGRLAHRLRVLTGDETRSRRLRLGSDPALVVSCWSDASSARTLPDGIVSGADVNIA